MSRAAFPPEARLCEPVAFRAVFARGRKFVTSGFVIIAAPRDDIRPRLGLALAKRRIRRAVDRNRVKRIVRESFRQNQTRLGGVDIVVLARSRTENISNTELFAQLADIWPRIGGLDAATRAVDERARQR